jgi:hypothetical protein
MNPNDASIQAGIYIGVLIVLALIGGFVILAVRRRMLAKDSATADETVMEAMRRMRDSGEITQAEYEATIRSIASRFGKPSTNSDAAGHAGASARLALARKPGAPNATGVAPTPEIGDRQTPPTAIASPAAPDPHTPLPAPSSASSSPAAPQPPRIDDFPPLIELPPIVPPPANDGSHPVRDPTERRTDPN